MSSQKERPTKERFTQTKIEAKEEIPEYIKEAKILFANKDNLAEDCILLKETPESRESAAFYGYVSYRPPSSEPLSCNVFVTVEKENEKGETPQIEGRFPMFPVKRTDLLEMLSEERMTVKDILDVIQGLNDGHIYTFRTEENEYGFSLYDGRKIEKDDKTKFLYPKPYKKAT